jgi:uncharacterized membrane protein
MVRFGAIIFGVLILFVADGTEGTRRRNLARINNPGDG